MAIPQPSVVSPTWYRSGHSTAPHLQDHPNRGPGRPESHGVKNGSIPPVHVIKASAIKPPFKGLLYIYIYVYIYIWIMMIDFGVKMHESSISWIMRFGSTTNQSESVIYLIQGFDHERAIGMMQFSIPRGYTVFIKMP